MKLRWILTLAGLTCVLAAAAPASALEGVGIALGVDRTKLSGDEPRDFRPQTGTGFKVGAIVEFKLTADLVLSLQPGYLRTATGLAYKDEASGDVRDSLDLDIDWIEVPIIVRVETGSALFATGGLDFSFVSGGGISGGATEIAADSIFKDMDIAAVFGLGVGFPVGRYELTGELRYRQGLVNMAREGLGDRLDTMPPRFRYAGFQLQFGLMLPWGGRR